MAVAIAIPLVIGVGCAVTFLLGYLIGGSVGYSKGRRDGWMQYDSIVPDIRDECEQLKRGGNS